MRGNGSIGALTTAEPRLTCAQRSPAANRRKLRPHLYRPPSSAPRGRLQPQRLNQSFGHPQHNCPSRDCHQRLRPSTPRGTKTPGRTVDVRQTLTHRTTSATPLPTTLENHHPFRRAPWGQRDSGAAGTLRARQPLQGRVFVHLQRVLYGPPYRRQSTLGT